MVMAPHVMVAEVCWPYWSGISRRYRSFESQLEALVSLYQTLPQVHHLCWGFEYATYAAGQGLMKQSCLLRQGDDVIRPCLDHDLESVFRRTLNNGQIQRENCPLKANS